MHTQFNPQFKFEKQVVTENTVCNILPEQVIMISLQNSMKILKIRSFKSYLKWVGTNRIQRSDLSFTEIASLLNISVRAAENLAFDWREKIGGQVVYTCGLNTYYLKDVYEIVN